MDRILISLKKENGPRASSAPALGLNTIIFKHVYWYMQQTQVSVYRTIGPLVLIFAPKQKLWVHVRTASEIYIKKKSTENFQFLQYISHGHVFVMQRAHMKQKDSDDHHNCFASIHVLCL